jgi:aldehyde dehydrogenase
MSSVQPISEPNYGLKPKYGNYIGGKWVAPAGGEYFEDISPVNGKTMTMIPRSQAEDIELALDAAHEAAASWGKTSVAERCSILMKIADRMEENLEMLAQVETWDNGKSIRETMLADLPLAIDHFRYFAAVIRAEAGEVSDLDANTVTMEVHEPLGVVGQIIPWNFPILMATWKLAPALAAGNCVVLKPAEQTPASILVLAELIDGLLPPGVLNIVNGFGPEAGKPLASSSRIGKIAFTGDDSVMAKDDEFFDKSIEGFVMFALNQGEVCTCPSRALVQESIYDEFMERALKRVAAIKMGSPLESSTMMGAQASNDQFEKIMNYLDIGRQEGAEVLIGGNAARVAEFPDGYYVEPTVFRGNNKMRIFQEEIFGPVVSVTTFKDDAEAMEIANDTLYGLGAGVWSRDIHQVHEFAGGIQAGRIWVNCYHLYPAHASFGGYKQSGIGRENHKMMLDHYRHTKNILTSYDKNAMGFF